MDNFFNIDNKSGIIGKIKLVMLVLFFTLICIEVSANINYQVSCDFDSQDLRFVLKDLAGQAKANIVIDDNLQRRVTLNLENVPFIDALEMLEQAFSLDVVINNEIIIVTQRSQYNTSYNQTNSEASSSEIIQLNSKTPNEIIEVIKAISNELTIVVFEEQDILVVSGPYSKVNLAQNAISSWYNKPKQDELIKSVAIKLNYIDTQDLSYLSGLSSGVRILALNNINTVIVTGSESGVANTVQLIQTLDKPPKVVQISVEMLEVKQGDLENIGVSLKSSSGYNSLAIKWDEQNFQQNPWSGKDEKEEVDLLDFIKLRPLVRASLSLITEVNLLKEEGKAKILARPSLTTLENKTAKIHTGERYTIVLHQNNYQQLQYIDVGVQLEITPKVDDDGFITAIINPIVSALTGLTKEGYPRISTRQAKTTVRVRDGETLIIGGLVEETELQASHGIPILGQLPVFRLLFGGNKSHVEKTELIMIVTFNLIDDH